MERLQEAESGLKMKLQSWPEEPGAEAEAESASSEEQRRFHAMAIVKASRWWGIGCPPCPHFIPVAGLINLVCLFGGTLSLLCSGCFGTSGRPSPRRKSLGLCSQGCSVCTRGPAEGALMSSGLQKQRLGACIPSKGPPPSVCFLCSRQAFQALRQLSWRGRGGVWQLIAPCPFCTGYCGAHA